MRVACLVLAHDHPRHLTRLLRALHDPAMTIFVHLDARATDARFRGARELSPWADFIEPRVPVYWAGFSIVEATIRLMRAAQGAGPFDYYALLSGVDYPLVSNAAILSRLGRDPRAEYIGLARMPSPATNKYLERLYVLHLEPEDGVPIVSRLTRRFNRHARQLALGWPVARRNYRRALGGMVPYAGPQWWCLTHAATEHILLTLEGRPELARFFRHTWAPDEILFHTIMGNSPMAERCRPTLTFADWPTEHAPHPRIFDWPHLETLTSARALGTPHPGAELFARKFTDASEDLVRAIDAQLRGAG